jgi:hypothetical protein
LCPKKDVCEPIFLPAQDAPRGETCEKALAESAKQLITATNKVFSFVIRAFEDVYSNLEG